jgi:N-methylhydantoinase B
VARRYRDGELDVLDLVRQYGVIVDWGSGELLPRTTAMFRDMVRRRAAAHWEASAAQV